MFSQKHKVGHSSRTSMDFHVQDKQIQKKIDWISSQIRETKIQLKREYKELEDALKEQEKLRKKNKIA